MKFKEYLSEEKNLIGQFVNRKEITKNRVPTWYSIFDCTARELTSLVGSPTVVVGDFFCDNNRLTSLKGSPEQILGRFNCDRNKLTSVNKGPKYIKHRFSCSSNNIESFKDIHKHINHIGGLFDATLNPVKSHILGLLMIDGIQRVYLDNMEVVDIVNKHLGKGRTGVIAAQAELIEAGFPEYAQL